MDPGLPSSLTPPGRTTCRAALCLASLPGRGKRSRARTDQPSVVNTRVIEGSLPTERQVPVASPHTTAPSPGASVVIAPGCRLRASASTAPDAARAQHQFRLSCLVRHHQRCRRTGKAEGVAWGEHNPGEHHWRLPQEIGAQGGHQHPGLHSGGQPGCIGHSGSQSQLRSAPLNRQFARRRGAVRPARLRRPHRHEDRLCGERPVVRQAESGPDRTLKKVPGGEPGRVAGSERVRDIVRVLPAGSPASPRRARAARRRWPSIGRFRQGGTRPRGCPRW